MIPRIILTTTILLCLCVAGALGQGQATSTGTPAVTSMLPASLDSLFPPHAQGPRYLLAMHELAAPLSAIVVDLMENDRANAMTDFESFKAKYTAMAQTVPEWRDRFPMGPVENLGKALSEENPDKVMAAVGQMGQTCNQCHFKAMPAGYFKYHWPDFSSVSVTDPLSNKDVPFAQLMQMLETNMTGVGIDLAQGQKENVRRQAQGFAARFAAMKGACASCHESEPKYYVDQDITSLIDELNKQAAQPEIDGKAVGQLLDKIGMESCFKCHLVHIPAAYSSR
jgi:cytochrome c556